jgi:hypothetical protein
LGNFDVEDDSANGGARRAPRNVLGEPLSKRRVWSCALLTRPRWVTVRSPISSASQWT